MNNTAGTLSEKIQTLNSDQLAEVEELVARLQSNLEDASLSHASAHISEPAFAAIWSNPEDDAYDAL